MVGLGEGKAVRKLSNADATAGSIANVVKGGGWDGTVAG